MMDRMKVLCKVVRSIIVSSMLEDVDDGASYLIFYPMVIHVPMFWALAADGGVKVAFGSIVISLEVGGALNMAEFFKGDADWYGGNAVVMKCPSFWFSSRGRDVAKGGAFSEDDPIRGYRKGSIGRGGCLGRIGPHHDYEFWVLQGRRHHSQHGVACRLICSGLWRWVCMRVIHEHLGFCVGGLRGLGLLGGDFIDDREHAWVNGACIVGEGFIDRLGVFDTFGI